MTWAPNSKQFNTFGRTKMMENILDQSPPKKSKEKEVSTSKNAPDLYFTLFTVLMILGFGTRVVTIQKSKNATSKICFSFTLFGTVIVFSI